jgi:hypothetical protein
MISYVRILKELRSRLTHVLILRALAKEPFRISLYGLTRRPSWLKRPREAFFRARPELNGQNLFGTIRSAPFE